MRLWSSRSSASPYSRIFGILDRDEPVVDALRHHLLRHRVVHETARDIDLANGSVRPRDHLGGEHRANAELLADGDEHRVHAGRIRSGELRDVADPHHHLGGGPAPPRLGVALQRRGEAESDRLDHRVDEVGDTELRERLERGRDGFQGRAKIGKRNDANAAPREIAGDAEVASVDAQHECRARVDRGANLLGDEAVDAHADARRHELAHDIAERGEGEAWRAADVDVVGARVAEAKGLAHDRIAREARRVVDLRDDLDVPRAVVLARGGLAEELGDLAQILRALVDAHGEPICDRLGRALAESGDQHEIGACGYGENASRSTRWS